MDENYRKALSEISDIIKYSDKESRNKISDDFLEFVENNKDPNYKTKITPEKKIEEQEILYETKVILSAMYRDFFATDEERKVIEENVKLKVQKQKEDFEKTIKSEEEMFKNTKENVEKIAKEISMVNVEEKESIFTKIKNFIKRLFKN